MDTLRAYNWPGNVRELRNYVQRAYIMSDDTGISTEAVPLQVSTTQASVRVHADDPGRHVAGECRQEDHPGNAGAVRRREEACRRTARHQPQDAVQRRLEEYGNSSNSEGENGKAQTTEA